MNDLKNSACVPCEEGGESMKPEDIENMLQNVSGWEWVDKDKEDKIVKSFKFKNFAEAIAFANKVGEIAEEQGHHPKLIVEWGKVTVKWWTHKIGGLHRNDFIMAAKTDELL